MTTNWYDAERECSYCLGIIDADERYETGLVGEVFHVYCAELIHMYRSGEAKKYLPPKPGWYDCNFLGRVYVYNVVAHVEKDIVPGKYSPVDEVGFSWFDGPGDDFTFVPMEEAVREQMTWTPAPGPYCIGCNNDIPVEGMGDVEPGSFCKECRDAKTHHS